MISINKPHVGVLTGTFDPFHLGHLALAHAAMREAGLTEVWVYVNPLPEHKENTTSFSHRLEMAKLAIENEHDLSLYTGELMRLKHTYATFFQLMETYPGVEFTFIVGLDTLVRLDTWDDIERVVLNTAYIAAARRGTGQGELRALRKRLGPIGAMLKVTFLESDEYSAASSTAARLAHGRAEQGTMLAPAVIEYIQHHGLYQ